MPDGFNELDETMLPLLTPQYLTFAQFNAINQFRFNWSLFTIWMGDYTNARVLNSPGLPAIADRLLQGVPREFYNSIKLFFGPIRAQEFSNYLSLFISTYFRYLESQINGDIEGVSAATKDLYNVIEAMANYLGSINAFWSVDIWNNLLTSYLGMTFDKATYTLAGDYDMVIQIDDRLLYQSIVMADYMAQGVIAEFVIS